MKWLALACVSTSLGVACLDYSNFQSIPEAIGMGLLLFGPFFGLSFVILQIVKYLNGVHLTEKRD